MASNYNRNDSLSKRSKINIERNDLSDKSAGDDGFAMPAPEDDFWKPVVPGSESPDDDGRTDFYDGESKIASACARIQNDREQVQSPRFKPSKHLFNDDYSVKVTDSIFDRGYDRKTSFSQRRRNPSPVEDLPVDLLSFDEPEDTFKYPVLTPAPSARQIHTSGLSGPESDSASHLSSTSPDKGGISVEGACSAESFASANNFDVLESSRKMLYEMFHQVPPHRIDRILEECEGSVTRCTDLLLEYHNPEESKPNDNFFAVRPLQENQLLADHPNFGKRRNRNLSGPTSTVTSCDVTYPEFGGILPNSLRHSQTNYTLNFADLEEGKMYIPESCINSKLNDSSPESENYATLDDSDLFVPIDGEDWFDFQLTPDFVRDLFNAYSEPGRLTVAEMTPDSPELKIRIPPKLAFKLYQMMALSMMQRSMDRERPTLNSLAQSSRDSSDDPPGNEQDFDLPNDNKSESDSDLEKFVREEMKLSLRELQTIRFTRDRIQNEMATKLTLAKLKAVFPSLSNIVIEEAFDRNGSRFEDTVRTLKVVYPNKLETTGLEENFQGCEEIIAETIKEELTELCALSVKFGAEDMEDSELTAEDWRNKATKHHVLRNQYQQKGQVLARQGLSGALVYYSKMFNLHTDRMLASNARAASIIMHEFKRRHGKQNVLDLHHLYVAEAVDALHNHLMECSETLKEKKVNRMEIRVITGKGNNSKLGVARITPAIIAYLKSHHYSFLELPGSVVVTLKAKERKFQY